MDITRRETLGMMALLGAGGLAAGELVNMPANVKAFVGPEATPSPVRLQQATPKSRELLRSLLGDLPYPLEPVEPFSGGFQRARVKPAVAKKLNEEERDGYILETLEFDLNGIEKVPAYLAKPKNLSGPAPAVLFNHSHGGGYDIGKKEFIEGRKYLQDPPYAQVLTDQGYIGLCIDHWVFGERAHTSENDMFKAMLWQGRVLWGMMIYDSLRAMDYLLTRDEVDANRIGTLGISMGSTMAWWLAALDERVKVTVDICCLTEFHVLLRQGGLGRHGVYYYVPDLLKHFTTSDINALIAPRPHLGLAGLQDGLTPVEGLDIIDAEMQRVYAEHGVPENWKLLRYDVGHQETPEGRQEILKFLKFHLDG